jgi:protocatechuate 3,4-dioxygenase beta subunit
VDGNNNVFPASRGKVTVLRYTYDERGRKALAQAPVVHEGAIGTHGRMDDRGDYRLYGLQPGDYYISASGGGHMVFYPGTPDETSAEPVRVRAGEELRLATIVVPAAQKRTPVRFRPVGLEGESLGETVDSGALSFYFDNGRALSFLSEILFSRQMPPDPGVRSTELAPGKYDVLIGLNGMRTTAELFYAHAAFTVGNTEMEQEVRLNRGIRVTGSITLEDAAGSHPNPPGVLCRLYSAERHLQTVGASTSKGCLGAAFSSAHYDLEMMGMPSDAYVESAQAGGEDILANGLQLSGDAELQIVIRSPGSVIEGTVTDSGGDKLSDAVVALVPDAPLRAAGVLYRSVISDVNGRYQLRGVAPGSYQLFAWAEIEGAAYRNAEFMKDFDGKGRPVRVQAAGRMSIDLTVF